MSTSWKNTWHSWESWRDIMAWAEDNGFTRLSKRMAVNNACWSSSGEFGRSQVYICDSLRFTDTEKQALAIAEEIEEELKDDIVLEYA